MAKRKKSQGKSARHGNSKSPYQKYEKKPYQYSADYRSWRNNIVGKIGKANNRYASEAEAERRV